MANYANKYFEEFISEGDLKEAILMPGIVPENMYTFKELDYFFKNLFKEKRESNKQNLENLFEKLRNKTRQKQPAELFYEKRCS